MDPYDQIRQELLDKREQLSERLGRIRANRTRKPQADAEERATEMANVEVVDALGKETSIELQAISKALSRIDAGEYANCAGCGDAIPLPRLQAYPLTDQCIDCASNAASR